MHMWNVGCVVVCWLGCVVVFSLQWVFVLRRLFCYTSLITFAVVPLLDGGWLALFSLVW